MEEQLTRRGLLAAAAVAAALPLVRSLPATAATRPADPSLADGTLQAFFDAIVPGRRVARTDLGLPVHPRAISGADDRPGAVQADALALSAHPLVGFDALAPAFLADLELHAAAHGGPFLLLGAAAREATCVDGLADTNPLRVVWEAAAAVAFAAIAGGLAPAQTAQASSGYRLLGHPGAAPDGYARFSYGRRLARGRTGGRGSLP